ncbi:MAG: hypothetical protein GOMPHAMPRED_001181, partial [Gomphillus americanus]
MKYAIVFLSIAAAGPAASVSSSYRHALPELRHPYQKAFLDSRDAPILISRGESDSGRKTTPSKRPPRRPVIETASKAASTETEAKVRDQAASSGRGSKATPRANTPQQRSTPSRSSSSASRNPGSQQLLQEYLRQEHVHQKEEKELSPRLYHPQPRSRAPQLIHLIENHQVGNLEGHRNPSLRAQQRYPYYPHHAGWGGLPSYPEQDIHEQLYSHSRTAHLLGLVQNASNRNIHRYQAEQYEKYRQHFGWGGQPIPRPAGDDTKGRDEIFGAGGFPNLRVHSDDIGPVRHKKIPGTSSNPRVDRRDVSPNQAPISSFALT